MLAARMDKLTPYVPGEQPRDKRYIKLNTNENPYPPPPEVMDFLKTYDANDLRLYPDHECAGLREAIAAYDNVDADNVFVGNGSDEVLSFCFYAFFDSDRGPVLFPNFTYSFYPVYCDFYGIPYRTVPLRPDLSLEIDAFKQRNGGIVLANPNAPTGLAVSLPEIETIINCRSPDTWFLLDEAYIDFGGERGNRLLDEYPNVLIVRTMSKGFSMAGLRIGYALGPSNGISALNKVKNSFNSYPVDRLAQELAIIAIKNARYYVEINQRVVHTRDRIISALRSIGWMVVPSSSNFIFAKHPSLSGEAVQSSLRRDGILVRHFKTIGIENYLRISIGSDSDMDTFLAAVSAYGT